MKKYENFSEAIKDATYYAINIIENMNNISIEVSNDFRKKYKNNYNDTPKNALLNLFNAQKKPFENTPKEGKFQFENIGGIIYRRDNKTGIVSKQGKAPKFKLP